ncbi:histone deacetylase [Simiduia sp. 21SJ11W-1]|uniref:histone deacetylase family protein n=1 Tax=Simiduia sp. 21SJ11W-1 TaxID=2909669 RepID=UPI0020A027F5|nr:histone deacetylase [Simiduia sp. 21SJ11W-1]UTA48173.1 histone deacetylase [Simiduia sp. 21SJ11W-1]
MLPLVTHPAYSYPFPAKHRFPMQKFGLLHAYLQSLGIATRTNTLRPGRCQPGLLTLAHDEAYVGRFVSGQLTHAEVRRMGLPWSEGLKLRTCISPAGTLLAAHYALEYGVACHLAGGTHHAHRDFASGFCIFNDLAITARAMLAHTRVRKVLIFDVDVHQGDGTARILEGDTQAFTCSVHCEKNFPVRKAASDLDINLPVAMGDDAYLSVVSHTFAKLLREERPDLVLYDAGVDVYADDPLGLLNISEAAIAARDRDVLRQAREAGVPIATVIGGGYDRDQQALARRHALCVEQAAMEFAGI